MPKVPIRCTWRHRDGRRLSLRKDGALLEYPAAAGRARLVGCQRTLENAEAVALSRGFKRRNDPAWFKHRKTG